jgi:predicted nucleotidyltransferase component of viral defense system
MMNARALSDKAKSLSKELDVTPHFIINHYFFDAVLKRIASSNYKDIFILKGGYLLSIRLGILTRTTNDLDFSIGNEEIDIDDIQNIILDILAVNINDSITFEIKEIVPIKDGNGVRFNILAKLENIRQSIHIDIATNDPITPAVIINKYETIISNEVITLHTYPYETILAEKLQTVVSLGTASSRAKDLYDLYVLANMFGKSLNKEQTINAIQTTFQFRDTNDNPINIITELNEIRDSNIQLNLWENYVRKHYFTKGMEFYSIIDSIIQLVKKLFDMK